LKKGLGGFSYPEDRLISKSKWFPVIYSWEVRDKQYSVNLFRLQFDYLQTRFRSIFFLSILPGAFLYLDIILRVFFELDLLQRLSLIFIPLILSFIALYVELRNNVGNKKARLDEYSTYLQEMGLGYIIAKNEQFIEQHYKPVVLVGNTMLRKMQLAPTWQTFPIGIKEVKKQPSRSRRLLRKLHLIPKSSASIEKERIPVFYSEDAHHEYMKRIKELAEES